MRLPEGRAILTYRTDHVYKSGVIQLPPSASIGHAYRDFRLTLNARIRKYSQGWTVCEIDSNGRVVEQLPADRPSCYSVALVKRAGFHYWIAVYGFSGFDDQQDGYFQIRYDAISRRSSWSVSAFAFILLALSLASAYASNHFLFGGDQWLISAVLGCLPVVGFWNWYNDVNDHMLRDPWRVLRPHFERAIHEAVLEMEQGDSSAPIRGRTNFGKVDT